MGIINQDTDLYLIFRELNRRIEVLEKSVRFTAPVVATDPANPRKGDIWVNSTTNLLKAIDKNGVVKTITWS